MLWVLWTCLLSEVCEENWTKLLLFAQNWRKANGRILERKGLDLAPTYHSLSIVFSLLIARVERRADPHWTRPLRSLAERAQDSGLSAGTTRCLLAERSSLFLPQIAELQLRMALESHRKSQTDAKILHLRKGALRSLWGKSRSALETSIQRCCLANYPGSGIGSPCWFALLPVRCQRMRADMDAWADRKHAEKPRLRLSALFQCFHYWSYPD